MPRGILGVTVLLAMLAGCRDGPELIAPVEVGTPQPIVTASVDAVQMVIDVLNDPFVSELLGATGTHTEPVYTAARNASISETEEHLLKLSHILTATAGDLLSIESDVEEGPDEGILRAALALVLDDAATLLQGPPLGPERQDRESDLVQY